MTSSPLQDVVSRARRIVFFGGAGVSTASGIPDFRSGDGLYASEFEGLTPEMILSQSFFYLDPETFFRFYRRHMLHPEARPNAAHEKLYELEKADKLRGIVTQNIDGLHKVAGNRRVYEVHGSVHENYCMDCNAFFPMEKVLNSEGIPRCDRCGGVVKPWVVLYGEAPDKYTCMGACREISNADTLIVAGTSLTVYPAASYVRYCGGNHMILVNRDETPYDSYADLVIHDKVGEVLSRL